MFLATVLAYCLILTLISHVSELLTIKALFYAGSIVILCGLIDHSFPDGPLFYSHVYYLRDGKFNHNTGVWFIHWWVHTVLEPIYLCDFGLFIPNEGILHKEL
jgi:hypothetical protein